MKNAYEQYKSVTVVGKDPLQLMVMLYDGAISSLNHAKRHISEGSIEQAHNELQRAKQIVIYLLSSLNPSQGTDAERQLSSNLSRLYAFCYERIGAANLKKDPAEIDAVITVLDKLRAGWVELRQSGAWTPPQPCQNDEHVIELAEA